MADKYDDFLDAPETGAPASVDKYDAFLDDSVAVPRPAAPQPAQFDRIPGAVRPFQYDTRPEPGFVDKYIRAPIETAAQMVTSAPASVIGQSAGIVRGLFGGKYGLPEGVREASETANKVSQYFTYQPRGQAGQDLSKKVGDVLTASGIAGVPIPVMNDLSRGMAPAVRAIGDTGKAAVPAVAKAVRNSVEYDTLTKGFAARQQAAREAASTADWQRAAPIEAAKAARSEGIVLNPSSVSETPRTIRMAAAGGSAHFNTAASIANKSKWNDMVRSDLGLGKNAQLTSQTYDSVRKVIAKPYDEAASLGKLKPDADILAAIREIDIPEVLPAGEVAAGKMARTTDYITSQIESGMTGKMAVDTARTLRREAKQVFDSVKSGNRVSPIEIDAAKAKMQVAEKVDSLISSNISDPKWKTAFDDSRRKMALTYAYERATNLARRQIDPQVFAQEMQGRHYLTGNAKKMGEIAANYPEIANVYAEHGTTFGMPVRSGVAGTTGFAVGSLYGSPVATSAIAASVSRLGEKVYGKRLRSEAAQKKLATPVDRRIPEHNTGMMEP